MVVLINLNLLVAKWGNLGLVWHWAGVHTAIRRPFPSVAFCWPPWHQVSSEGGREHHSMAEWFCSSYRLTDTYVDYVIRRSTKIRNIYSNKSKRSEVNWHKGENLSVPYIYWTNLLGAQTHSRSHPCDLTFLHSHAPLAQGQQQIALSVRMSNPEVACINPL